MSEAAINRIRAEGLERARQVHSVEDGLTFLNWMVAAMARQSADHLFLKITTERGWSPATVTKAVHDVANRDGDIVEDTMRKFGDAELTADLVDASIRAFEARLLELWSVATSGGRA